MSQDVPKAKTTRISKMLAKRTKCHWATSSLKKSVIDYCIWKLRWGRNTEMVIKSYSPEIRQEALGPK